MSLNQRFMMTIKVGGSCSGGRTSIILFGTYIDIVGVSASDQDGNLLIVSHATSHKHGTRSKKRKDEGECNKHPAAHLLFGHLWFLRCFVHPDVTVEMLFWTSMM